MTLTPVSHHRIPLFVFYSRLHVVGNSLQLRWHGGKLASHYRCQFLENRHRKYENDISQFGKKRNCQSNHRCLPKRISALPSLLVGLAHYDVLATSATLKVSDYRYQALQHYGIGL